MSEQVKNLFTQISGRYDRLNHVLSFHIDRLWRNKTICHIKKETQTPLIALDLCAGTLDLTLAFLKRFTQSHVVAADFCHSMLLVGQKKLTPFQQNKISLVCADALKLPFSNKQFDVIFCGYGFRNLDDKALGLSEMYRLLKPGGQVIILEFFKPQKRTSLLFHQTYARYLLPWLGKIFSGNQAAYEYLRDSIGQFLTTHECIDLFSKCGFLKIEKQDLFLGISSIVSATKP